MDIEIFRLNYEILNQAFHFTFCNKSDHTSNRDEEQMFSTICEYLIYNFESDFHMYPEVDGISVKSIATQNECCEMKISCGLEDKVKIIYIFRIILYLKKYGEALRGTSLENIIFIKYCTVASNSNFLRGHEKFCIFDAVGDQILHPNMGIGISIDKDELNERQLEMSTLFKMDLSEMMFFRESFDLRSKILAVLEILKTEVSFRSALIDSEAKKNGDKSLFYEKAFKNYLKTDW